jgi:hypothetical protein
LLLELLIYSNFLGLRFTNSSAQEIRLWESENSWGWFSIFLQLKDQSNKDGAVIKRKSREWTENAPDFFALAPGQSHELRLDINDGWWEVSKDISQWKDAPVLVQAKYEVARTAEADKHTVFVGSAASDWVQSRPPHDWLFSK